MFTERPVDEGCVEIPQHYTPRSVMAKVLQYRIVREGVKGTVNPLDNIIRCEDGE